MDFLSKSTLLTTPPALLASAAYRDAPPEAFELRAALALAALGAGLGGAAGAGLQLLACAVALRPLAEQLPREEAATKALGCAGAAVAAALALGWPRGLWSVAAVAAAGAVKRRQHRAPRALWAAGCALAAFALPCALDAARDAGLWAACAVAALALALDSERTMACGAFAALFAAAGAAQNGIGLFGYVLLPLACAAAAAFACGVGDDFHVSHVYRSEDRSVPRCLSGAASALVALLLALRVAHLVAAGALFAAAAAVFYLNAYGEGGPLKPRVAAWFFLCSAPGLYLSMGLALPASAAARGLAAVLAAGLLVEAALDALERRRARRLAAPPPPPEPGAPLCSICAEGAATWACLPCGHRCACRECLATEVGRSRCCPLCRAPVASIARIYV